MSIKAIVSGGQTGADQGGLFAAKDYDIPTCGLVPEGWLTESGPAPWLADYGLKVMLSPAAGGKVNYKMRTIGNVQMSDCVIWFGNPHSAGGKCTLNAAVNGRNIDTFIVMCETTPKDVADWLIGVVFEGSPPATVMIAGNRESKKRGICAFVRRFMGDVFRFLKKENQL